MPQQQLANNGRRVERAIVIAMFLIQIGAIALSYGMLRQQVTDMSDRIGRLERWVDEGLNRRHF